MFSIPKITINYKDSGLYLNVYDDYKNKRLSHLSLHKNVLDSAQPQIHLKIGRSFQGLYKILLKDDRNILLWLIPSDNNVVEIKEGENFHDIKFILIDLYTILLNKIFKYEEL